MGTPTHVPGLGSDSGPNEETLMHVAANPSNGDGHAPRSNDDSLIAQENRQTQHSSQNDTGTQAPPETRNFAGEETRDDSKPHRVGASSDATMDFPPPPDGTIDQPAHDNEQHFSVSSETAELSNLSEETGNFAASANQDLTGEAMNLTGSLPNASDFAEGGTPAENQTGEYTPQAEPGEVTPRKKKASVPLPTSVAGYEVLQVLGRGAMGVVYKARQRGLKRLVALKMILSGEHASAQDLGRFQAEANAVAQLHHPGIVQIYEIGEDAGRPFFSLEYVDGPSLHKKLQGNPLPAREAAALMQKMAEAMHYAHQRGVIHRDLKPANVLLTSDGVPKIGDFGLAKRLEDDESGLTRTGAVLGTPSYMSPEQASGLNDQVGQLADVYSLGAILYDMLTGRPPFRGTSIMDTLQQLRTREPVPPIHLQPGVPRDLETICLKCLEKDRFKRYADAGALAEDLRRYLSGEPILARPISKLEKAWRWSLRNKKDAAMIAAGFVSLIAVIVIVVVFNRQLAVEKTAAIVARQEEEQAKIDANDQRDIAEIERKKAVESQLLAEKKRQEAEESKKLAEEKRKLAELQTEAQRGTASKAVDGMISMVRRVHGLLQSKKRSVAASDEAKKLRNEVLLDLRQSLYAIVSEINKQATVTYADQLALQLLGDLLMDFGQIEEPRELYLQAWKLATDRAQKEPGVDLTRANLGVLEVKLGLLALEMEWDARTALEHFLKARDLHENIRVHPISNTYPKFEIMRIVSGDDILVGRALMALGRTEEARKYFEEARRYRAEWAEDEAKDHKSGRPRSFLMESTMYLGKAATNLGDFAAAEKYFQQTLALGEGLMKEYPLDKVYSPDQAESEGYYGDLMLRHGAPEEAKKHYLASARYLKEWVDHYPDNARYQWLLALTQERLGMASKELGKQEDAKIYFQDAMQLRRELYLIEERNLARKMSVVLAMARAGNYENAAKNCAVIRKDMMKSTELMLQVARCHAICARDSEKDREKNIEQALSALAVAIGTDFKDAEVLTTDVELANLREQPSFQELIARIKKQ